MLSELVDTLHFKDSQLSQIQEERFALESELGRWQRKYEDLERQCRQSQGQGREQLERERGEYLRVLETVKHEV